MSHKCEETVITPNALVKYFKLSPFGKDLSLKDMLSSEVLFVELTSKSEIKNDAGILINMYFINIQIYFNVRIVLF